MSGQNVETVRALSRAFNEQSDDWIDFYDPQAIVHVPPGWLEDAVYSGHEGVAEVSALWTERVDEYRWDIEQLIDGGDCVVGLFRFSSRMRNDGVWLAPPLGAVFYFRDGKVAKILTYFSWDEALDAAGVQQ
jgi:ketosteroid isomerase-like protein